MQMTIMLLGCILGFATGVVAFAVLGFGLFVSIAIWAASGPLSVLFLASLHAARRRPREQPASARAKAA